MNSAARTASVLTLIYSPSPRLMCCVFKSCLRYQLHILNTKPNPLSSQHKSLGKSQIKMWNKEQRIVYASFTIFYSLLHFFPCLFFILDSVASLARRHCCASFRVGVTASQSQISHLRERQSHKSISQACERITRRIKQSRLILNRSGRRKREHEKLSTDCDCEMIELLDFTVHTWTDVSSNVEPSCAGWAIKLQLANFSKFARWTRKQKFHRNAN